MNSATTQSPASSTSVPWWRVPHMWMVIGGPLIVVVAAISTAYIAISGADPVLNKADYERELKAVQHLEGQARTEALLKMQPAAEARNHAASPHVTPRE